MDAHGTASGMAITLFFSPPRLCGGNLSLPNFEVLQHPRRNRILDDILILSGLKR
jgi:hypothetical protein